MSGGADLEVRVSRVRPEADGIRSFELVACDGGPLPAFAAGSHIDVRLPNGISRQYSLCNDPEENHRYLIGVLRDPASRGGSRYMHEQVTDGSKLVISAPKNHFSLAHGARRSILLAGGIGITPILCMAERLSSTGSDFQLHYSARSRDRAAFVQRLEQAGFAERVAFHFDDGAQPQKLALESVLAGPHEDTHLYVCGPKAYMDWILSAARAAGWGEEQLHHEFFSAGPLTAATDGEFMVRLASSGRSVLVASDMTVVQALAAQGIHIATSCEQGVCGTCLTRVLAGEPDHRDLYLTPEEQGANDQFTPCCSRSRTPELVLDL